MKKILAVMAVAVLFAGCVSSKEYKARVGEVDNMKQNVSQLRTRVSALEQENSALRTQLKTAQDEKVALQGQLKTAQNEKAVLQAGLKTAEDDKVALEARLRSAEEVKATLQQENAILRGQIAEIARQRDIAMAEKEKAISGLKSTYDNLVKELNKEIKTGQIAITKIWGQA